MSVIFVSHIFFCFKISAVGSRPTPAVVTSQTKSTASPAKPTMPGSQSTADVKPRINVLPKPHISTTLQKGTKTVAKSPVVSLMVRLTPH
jgi:hypothetical protein